MLKAFLVGCTIVLALAGCLDSSGESAGVAPSDAGNSLLPDFKPVEPTFEQDIPATLEAPPQWKQGEWWKIRLVDVGFTQTTYETTRVVVGQEGDHYLVGMPAAEFSDDFLLMHIPGFGQVAKEDLSFEIHNVPFAPVNFPLTNGATWETHFEGRLVNAKVFVESATTARVQMDGAQDHINVTYDTTVHDISKYVAPGYANYEVVEHGYNYTGLVTVPHMHQLVFNNFRIAGVLSGLPAVQPSLTDEITVDTTYDRVSFGLLFFNLAGPMAGGYYHEKATAPDGKSFELTVMPNDPAIVIKTIGMDSPGGKWTFEHQAFGPGIIGAEGIAYHLYNVEMPSGKVRASMGEHKHGGM